MSGVDHDSFVALIAGHKGILYKVAHAWGRSDADRHDLMQEILVQLWRSFHRYDDRFRFSTWMYRIAMNVAISFTRAESRRTRDVVSLEAFGLEVAGADQAMAEASHDLRRLQTLIQALEPLDRALILLYLDGVGHDDIAEVLGITAGNAATRVSRIKQKLQRELEA